MTTFENIIELLSIHEIIKRLSIMEKNEMIDRLQDLKSVYPFSDYEFVISSLLGTNKMTLDEYENMRDVYIQKNYYLDVFEMA